MTQNTDFVNAFGFYIFHCHSNRLSPTNCFWKYVAFEVWLVLFPSDAIFMAFSNWFNQRDFFSHFLLDEILNTSRLKISVLVIMHFKWPNIKETIIFCYWWLHYYTWYRRIISTSIDRSLNADYYLNNHNFISHRVVYFAWEWKIEQCKNQFLWDDSAKKH